MDIGFNITYTDCFMAGPIVFMQDLFPWLTSNIDSSSYAGLGPVNSIPAVLETGLRHVAVAVAAVQACHWLSALCKACVLPELMLQPMEVTRSGHLSQFTLAQKDLQFQGSIYGVHIIGP